MTTNQTAITGPNSLPTRSVPWRWNMKSAVRTTSVIGTTQVCRPGAATVRPSTAPSTEIAGVMTPSPKKIAVPKMPTKRSLRRSGGRSRTACEASASMAIRPPSPLLSARRMRTTYLTETMTVSVQKTSERTPKTFSGVSGTWPLAKTCFSA